MKSLIILFVVNLCLVSCSGEKEKISFDASRDTVFVIRTKKRLTTTINLLLRGYANDTIILQGGVKIPGGKINKKLQFDFYSHEYKVSYNHYKATKGEIDLFYAIP